MICPYCGHSESKVINSRSCQNGAAIRRRRECQKCISRFTTYEQAENIATLVVKKDGRREPFDRDKILRKLQVACHKRNVPFEDLERLVGNVEKQVQSTIEKEINARQIGEMVLIQLKEIDQVAYVRFASVYRDFADANEFIAEVRELLKQGNKTGS